MPRDGTGNVSALPPAHTSHGRRTDRLSSGTSGLPCALPVVRELVRQATHSEKAAWRTLSSGGSSSQRSTVVAALKADLQLDLLTSTVGLMVVSAPACRGGATEHSFSLALF